MPATATSCAIAEMQFDRKAEATVREAKEDSLSGIQSAHTFREGRRVWKPNHPSYKDGWIVREANAVSASA